ncbi:hypothetical protein HZC35_05355 [Candidatus Saganbacteria bacterium]|nr:hypothetical protein [Candidatus Saganbacteria bacterium]
MVQIVSNPDGSPSVLLSVPRTPAVPRSTGEQSPQMSVDGVVSTNPAGQTPDLSQPAAIGEDYQLGTPALISTPPIIPPPIAQDQIPSVLSGGEPPSEAEGRVEWGQASPPSSLKEALKTLGFSDSQIAKLTDEELEDGISLEELRRLDPDKTIVTDMAYNLLSRGGLGVNALGGVAADEDGIQLADVNRFLTEVVAPLVSGTGRSLEVIARFLKANKFRIISRHAAARAFRESTKEKEGLWTTTDGATTLSVKTLIDKYVRGELKGLAGKVLANILGHEISESDRLTEDQLANFFLTMYFVAKSDSPENIMSEAKDIPELEGDSPAKLIAWLTTGAENPVQAASTGAAEQSQQNPQGDMPEELREGLKLLYEFNNDQIMMDNDNKPLLKHYNTRVEQRQAYQKAAEHFLNVMNNDGISTLYKRQAAEYLANCYQALTQIAGTVADLNEIIDAAENQLGKIESILGVDKVIDLRNSWMQQASALPQDGTNEGIVFAQIKALDEIYTRPNAPAGLVVVAIPGEILNLALKCIELANPEYQRYALTLAEQLPERFIRQTQDERGQAQTQEISKEEVKDQLKLTIAQKSLPSTIFSGSELTGEALASEAQALLGILGEVVGVGAPDTGLLSSVITSLTGLIAQTTDPQKRSSYESLRDNAIRIMFMIAQTFIKASKDQGIDAETRENCKAAYKAIAQLMKDLGLEEVSLLPGEQGGDPIALGGRQGLIRALERGLNTNISSSEAQREVAHRTTETPYERPEDRERGASHTHQPDRRTRPSR